MNGLLEDLKHALRLYRRTSGATLVAVGVLAIGMAFVAAFVSLYVDLVLRPHPGFERGMPLIAFRWRDGHDAGGVPTDLINRIADESATIAAVAGTSVGLRAAGAVDGTFVDGEMVTREFFSGVRPRLALGRGFERAEHEPDGDPVIVISHRFWQDAYDGRADVIGTTLPLRRFTDPAEPDASERPEPIEFRIVGVMAPEYTGNLPRRWGIEMAFWIPVEQALPLMPFMGGSEDEAAQRLTEWLTEFELRAVGRRKAGVSAEAVASELNARFLADLPIIRAFPGARFDVLDGLVYDADVQRSTQRQLRLFLAGSTLLALVAAANVSLLLLARAPGRRRELATRMAVGAPLGRLVRQLASEAGLLVIVAAAFGLALSVWLAEFLRNLSLLRQAEWRDVTLLDWRVVAIVGGFVAVLTLLVSLAPILSVKKLGIAASSRQISARATFAQRIAGTAQLTIAAIVGGAAVAFAWYLSSVMLAYPGYETHNIHVARDTSYGVGDQARVRDAILGLPGVTAVSIARVVPGAEWAFGTFRISDPSDPAEQLQLPYGRIDTSFVDVLALTLLHGRVPTENEPTAILVNRTLARSLFGRDNVVGEFLRSGAATTEIVGVLEDVSFEHPLADIEPMMFSTGNTGLLAGGGVVLIESAQASGALQQQLQALFDSGAIEIRLNSVTPLDTLRANLLAPDRVRGFLTIGTAALVVLLAAFGFYGMQRYLVAAGRREYAIRASLGAGPSALGRLVFARGFLLGLPGLVLGLPLAFILVAWLRDDYVSRDISPALVTLAVAAGLAALLLAASIGPARRARATQPAPLLREE